MSTDAGLDRRVGVIRWRHANTPNLLKSSRPTKKDGFDMDVNRPEVTGRVPADTRPLAVTVQRACALTGLGPTTIWAFLKDGRLDAVRVPGVRRTLVAFASLERLLAPKSAAQSQQRRQRPSYLTRPAARLTRNRKSPHLSDSAEARR
jgi:hypothetical protein